MARKGKSTEIGLSRPVPPAVLMDRDAFLPFLVPAPELGDWVNATILAEDGPLYNKDHEHVQHGDIAYLWARSGFAKKGRFVLGQAEQVMIRASGWQKARQMQQLLEWFGREPEFIITVDAQHCAACSDVEFCSLIEHELYHIGHEKDEWGMPKFTESGLPSLKLRDHDVSEFVGVVERYGVGDPRGEIARMVAAAGRKPTVGSASVSQACGTCLLKVA